MSLWELSALILILSGDTFAYACALGADGISVGKGSIRLFGFVAAVLFTASVFGGEFLLTFISAEIIQVVGGSVLLFLGAEKVLSHSGKQKTDNMTYTKTLILSAAMNTDSVAAGLCAGKCVVPLPIVALMTYIVTAAVVFVGNRAGRKLSEISDIKFERLCGFMFITMAVMKLS